MTPVSTLSRPIDRTLASGTGALVAAVTVLSIAVLFLVSNMMLARLGIDYEVSGGSPLSKIHPGTYLALTAAVLLVVTRLDPFPLLDDVIGRHWGTLVFAMTVVLLLAQATLVQAMPATGIIDTFVLPIALFILLTRLRGSTLSFIAVGIHLVMAANAVLGLVELAGGIRLTPLVAAGIALTNDWRSSALLGHPLANAILTGAYMLLLMTGGGRDLPRGTLPVVLLLQAAAMFAFGGRAASVLLVAVAVPALIARAVAGRGPLRLGLIETAIGLVVAAMAVLAVLVVAASGADFFYRFFERFVEDQGSAETRIAMFSLIAQIPLRDLVFGPSPELVATLQRLEGIEFGIESFWVGMIAYFGVIVSLPLFLGLMLFLFRDVLREARTGAGWTALYVVAVASTSASFSGKTTSLALLVVMIVVLARRSSDAASRVA
jgi:hypothetical protein